MSTAPRTSKGSRNRASSDAADPDTGLRPSEVGQLKARLESELESLRERLRGRHASINEGDVDLADEMDQATRDQEHGYLLRLADKERKLLVQVERALSKIADGTYGLCEGTDEPIGFERLKARPWARYSIEYKEQVEREERDAKLAR